VSTKAEVTADFQAKSARRKQLRTNNQRQYRAGRENRRALSNGGAFGEQPSPIFNRCVLGTTGVERTTKDVSEYDDGTEG
jgi:hypothetical protein